jgi:hypothetical protein
MVTFIGHDSHARLPKAQIAKFLKEYDNFSKHKRNNPLHQAIRKAKEMYDKKNGIAVKNTPNNEFKIVIREIKKPTIRKSLGKRTVNGNFDCKGSGIINLGSSDMTEIMKKMINYLFYISKNIDTLDSEQECLIRVFGHLRDLRLNDPIGFLKVNSAM